MWAKFWKLCTFANKMVYVFKTKLVCNFSKTKFLNTVFPLLSAFPLDLAVLFNDTSFIQQLYGFNYFKPIFRSKQDRTFVCRSKWTEQISVCAERFLLWASFRRKTVKISGLVFSLVFVYKWSLINSNILTKNSIYFFSKIVGFCFCYSCDIFFPTVLTTISCQQKFFQQFCFSKILSKPAFERNLRATCVYIFVPNFVYIFRCIFLFLGTVVNIKKLMVIIRNVLPFSHMSHWSVPYVLLRRVYYRHFRTTHSVIYCFSTGCFLTESKSLFSWHELSPRCLRILTSALNTSLSNIGF